MLETHAMTALQLRKKALLLESDLNRLTLHVECARLGTLAGWLGCVSEAPHRLTPWLWVVAPLAGMAVALGLRRSSSGASFLTRALAAAPSLVHLWRTCAAPPNPSQ